MKVDTRAALVVEELALEADSALETDSDFEAAAAEEDDADEDEAAAEELFLAVLTPLV